MATPPAVLMVELVMSIDRMIQSAQSATAKPGEWSPATVIGHVSQVDEQVWMPRIAQMVQAHKDGAEPPKFSWWEPDAELTAAKFADFTLDAAGAQAMATRTQLLTQIRELTPEQWSAQANHDSFGQIDVSGLIIEILTHDEEHRASLVY